MPEPNIFHETVEAVNAAADRAKMAEQNAKESATEAGKHAASASESAVTAEKTKEDALRKVGEKKQEAIEAIQNQEETSVGNLTTHTDGEIQRIQNQTAESKGELEQTIINAGVSEEELDESIQTASDTKTALDKSVELARTAKTELDTSTQKAGEAKTALDGSAKTAGEMQETLSATVKQAGALDTSLGEEIETGTQLKTDLIASGEKAVQDIRTAGSEQLGKMQAVAEEFTADREQIATNKEDIGSLQEDLSNKITKFYASNQGETHLADSDNGKIMDMMLYGRSEQKQYSGKNLAHGKNENYYIDNDTSLCGFNNNDIGMAIDVSNLTSVTISTRSIQDRYRIGCVDTVPTKENVVTCYNEKRKDGTKDSYTIDTTDYNYLIVNATKLEDIQVEKGSEATSYEPYTGGIPSPNPDYPQEIKSVVNPVVKVVGKNVYNFGRHKGDYAFPGSSATAKVSENGSITIKGSVTDYASANIGEFLVDFPDGEYYMNTPKNNNVILQTIGGDGASFQSNTNDTIKFVKGKKAALYVVLLVAGTYNLTFTPMICKKREDLSTNDPYTEQLVQLPYTLNAIPVSSGGNVTINGQQYIADYVDVERGKVVRMCERKKLNTKNGVINEEYRLVFDIAPYSRIGNYQCIFSAFEWTAWTTCTVGSMAYIKNIQKPNDELYTAQELKELSIDFDVIYQLLEQQETDLTPEQTQALKELVTYYPVTNISVNSEQLDGYTVFNYPISMKNGWDYVKKQLNDNRDYIYDMDAKTQDIDTQSAEAYVNSEYAVALTELEV
ncbi:hypothetical protein NQ556_08820 [Coprococcus comes ATCC 27758]|uniref:hypothetical protein n=1 Tax=Coprococcus comes TaxID=410072 RepID=UPI0011CA339C|nr:hypothetical protein [Coprococcus comes]QRT50192.1 hypothetical protein I6K69_02480 [Coprococcus comes]UWP12765.1 hypothetical protein NQ556_08820 [Coprococcus comes ATCC 27758]